MSTPSLTSTSMQTTRVAHWKARSGACDTASVKVMAPEPAMAAPLV